MNLRGVADFQILQPFSLLGDGNDDFQALFKLDWKAEVTYMFYGFISYFYIFDLLGNYFLCMVYMM